MLWNKAISRKCLRSSNAITSNLETRWKHQGAKNQLYSNIQARSQSGDQAYSWSSLEPGLPSAEGQWVAEVGPFVALYRWPDQSHWGAVVRWACLDNTGKSIQHQERRPFLVAKLLSAVDADQDSLWEDSKPRNNFSQTPAVRVSATGQRESLVLLFYDLTKR